MKNTTVKNNISKIKSHYAKLRKNFTTAALKLRGRQALSLFFIYALVFIPLMTFDAAMPKVQAQVDPCVGANRIIQNCALGGGQFEIDLTSLATDAALEFHSLPPSDRDRMMRYGRNEIRAMLYAKVVDMIVKPNRTNDEENALVAFAAKLKDKRILSAQNAQLEYQKWQQNPCAPYLPPQPYTYNPGTSCQRSIGQWFAGPVAPTFEEFEAFGAAVAYSELGTPEAREISEGMTRNIAAVSSVGGAIIIGAIAAIIGSTLTFGTLSAITGTLAASLATLAEFAVVAPVTATATSGVIGASAIGGPVTIVLLAVATAVMRGIAVGNEIELPGKLAQAIIDAQNGAIDLREIMNTDEGKGEIYGLFLSTTLPDFPGTEIPAPIPTDRKFEISNADGSGTVVSNTISYKDWGNVCREARLSGGWFVDKKNGVEKQNLSIDIRSWNNESYFAKRRGAQFMIVNPININAGDLVDEFQYKDCGGVNRIAKIKFEQLTFATRGLLKVRCAEIQTVPDTGRDFTIGRIYAPADPYNELSVTVNGGTTATVNNITVRNLTITPDYQIKGNATYQNAPTPSEGEFTITVSNSIGQTSIQKIVVRKTATTDNFVVSVLPRGRVGENYRADFTDNTYPLSCSGFSYAVTGGALPAGTSLQLEGLGLPTIQGVAKSGGLYRFEISKIYDNGESVKKTYAVFIDSDMTEVPNGLVSWWMGEKDPADVTNASNGMLFNAVSYDTGKVNQGFKFFATRNGYMKLPDDTFSPSLDFTFELWFRTSTKGVILGRQRNTDPYDTPQNGATPAIYVDQNGKLRVQMFQNQNNQFTTSGTRVDNNEYHHVAVTYNRTTNMRTVYLDGDNIGSINLGQFADSNNKYQIGTGYVSDGLVGGMNGWFNFDGIIDEPALYNRVLSESEIDAIYAAGDAGKIQLNIIKTPPLTTNATNASITISTRGGTPGLKYSIDGGTTFKDTGTFVDLSAGNYTIVVKDTRERTITKQIAIENPPPVLNLTTDSVNPQCNGGQTGEIRIFPTGSEGPFEYSVRNGANVQESNVFTQLNGGSYTPWIRDLTTNTVYAGAPLTLNQPLPVSVSPTNFTNAQLGAPYSRTFMISGGTAPFTLEASGPDYTNGYRLPEGLTATADATSITISGTPQETGNFPILIRTRDQNGCNDFRNYPLVITSNATYGISGRATNGGQGLANVTITLAGAENRTTVTDTAGNYSFNTISGGADYTLTASLSGITFAPPTIIYNNLSANISDANFAVSPTTYEGDIAGRPNGDGAVNVLDLITIGRIINNLDPAPANGAEWQRTDIAPRSSLGNGVIDNNDLFQLRNYIINNNPRTPAGGAISASGFGKISDKQLFAPILQQPEKILGESEISTAKTSLLGGAQLTIGTVPVSGSILVPITLTSNGDVSAVQFTITYDSSKLFLSSVSAAPGLPSVTSFVSNSNTTGKVNILMHRQIDGSAVFPAGSLQILRLNFAVQQNATGFAAVGFDSAPTPLVAADPQANTVSLGGTAGGVSITPTAANVSVGGKVIAGNRGLLNAVVSLTDQNGAMRIVRTNSFGNYSFTDVAVGGNYLISVKSKGYTFAPQIVNVVEEISELNFVAQ